MFKNTVYKLVLIVLIFVAGNLCLAERITVAEITAPHPRLLVNSKLIAEIKADIKAARQPRTDALLSVKTNIDKIIESNRKFAPYTGNEPYTFFVACSRDSEPARDMALLYLVTGDQKYADNALKLLNGWAGAEPMPITQFDPLNSTSSAGMLIGRSVMQFVQVYDMLYDYPAFSGEQKKKVEQWFAVAVEGMKKGTKTWEENNYYNYQYFQNHLVADMMGIAFVGYALGDRELVQYAIDSEDNPRDFVDLLNGIILMENEKPYFREPGGWPIHNGEIADRYRHFAIAGHSGDYVTKPNRGLQYCHLSLSLMAIAAQAAHSNGLDLFNLKGDNGECLEESFAFYADFYRLKDSGMKGGFYFGECSRIAVGGDSPGLWELAYLHYPNNQDIYELIVSIDRPSQYVWLIGSPALMFGQQVKPLVAAPVEIPRPAAAPATRATYPPYKIVVPQITKPHPRLMMDGDDIAAMKQRVAVGEKPFADAWQLMKAELDAIMTSGVKPKPYTGDNSKEFFAASTGQSATARDLAIAWHITGDEKYGRAAVEYLYRWATAVPMPAAAFNPELRFPNSGMDVARASFAFLWAYDLMYNHPLMTDVRKGEIELWIRCLEKEIHEGVKRWHESDYFGQQYFQNHITAHVMGLTAIGYTLGDRELVQYAIDCHANPKDFVEVIEGAILVERDIPHDDQVKNVQSGEIIDRYRHRQAPGKGLQYSHLTLLTLAVTAEMCYNNGLDFYNYNNPNGENLAISFDFYADFYRLKDSTIKGGFYSGETDRIGLAGDNPALFELGFKHYPDSPDLIELMSSMDRASQKVWILGRAVLTHGQK